MEDRAGLGPTGEQYAERYLRKKRYRIVTRNYVCPLGEIDLVALDRKTIVFVEVKTRTGREHADPQDAVNAPKRQHITRVAEHFLRRTHAEDRQSRFDVVAITVTPDKQWHVEHLMDAFSPV
jgi:putative endonuclease